jgi:hypothetical protein
MVIIRNDLKITQAQRKLPRGHSKRLKIILYGVPSHLALGRCLPQFLDCQVGAHASQEYQQ